MKNLWTPREGHSRSEMANRRFWIPGLVVSLVGAALFLWGKVEIQKYVKPEQYNLGGIADLAWGVLMSDPQIVKEGWDKTNVEMHETMTDLTHAAQEKKWRSFGHPSQETSELLKNYMSYASKGWLVAKRPLMMNEWDSELCNPDVPPESEDVAKKCAGVAHGISHDDAVDFCQELLGDAATIAPATILLAHVVTGGVLNRFEAFELWPEWSGTPEGDGLASGDNYQVLFKASNLEGVIESFEDGDDAPVKMVARCAVRVEDLP